MGQLQVDIDKLNRVFSQLDETLNLKIDFINKKAEENQKTILELAEQKREMDAYIKYKQAEREEIERAAEVRDINSEDYDDKKPHNSITFV